MSGWEPNSDSFSMPQHFWKVEQTYYTKPRAQTWKYQYTIVTQNSKKIKLKQNKNVNTLY